MKPALQRIPVRRFTFGAALLLAVATPSFADVPPVAQSASAVAWDLAPIFSSDADWEQERQAFARQIPALLALRGSLGRDALALRQGLDQVSAANQRLQRLWVYASTQTSTDNRSRRNQERTALMRSLYGQFSSAIAWLDPEIQSIGAAKVDALLREDRALQRHETKLRNTLRAAKHTLAPEVESALAAVSPLIQTTANTRSLLIDADIVWPMLEVAGKPVKLNEIGYQSLREHPDRQVRQAAFDTFWKAYGQYENSLGALLAQRVQAGVIDARMRQHDSTVAASLAPNQIPEKVLRTLVAQTNEGLPTLHRYYKLRQRLLQLPDLHYYDVYPAMINSNRRFPVAESGTITLAAVAPLGAGYQDLLRQALSARTMHAHPAEGKSSGAYATAVYGLTPYIFLNHRDSYDSLTTFAHEWGHGMHTILAQRSQPYETAGYSLFLAEIASITNEVLLSGYMMQSAQTRDEKLFLLGQSLERLRASFFRQTMFAEFELLAHDAQERGEPLNGKRFTEMYCGLLRKYHGADAGVMTINPTYCSEWAFIPHFHRPFYVYAYATSTAAAYHFGEQILAGKPGAAESYLNVLRAGSSLPPHELLKQAGLDLASAEPYQMLMVRMNQIMDEVEKLL